MRGGARARARAPSMRLGTSLHLTYLMRRTGAEPAAASTRWRGCSACAHRRDVGADGASALRRLVRAGRASRCAPRASATACASMLSKGMALLALRVTDNAAATGEHYIARRRERVLRRCGARPPGAGLIIARDGAAQDLHLEARPAADRLRDRSTA
ncbi:MAG: site-specific recombinase [Comamonadaceae bacterium]|nr:site-specific recombinase [Comamonadaceae bacterium]